MKLLAHFSALAAASILLTNCGSPGGSDSSPPTVRPKTLDGLILRIDNAFTFEFVRNAGTPAAVNNGDIETGTFFYTSTAGNGNLRNYTNVDGNLTNIIFPASQVAGATYTYEAINSTSGVITLSGTGDYDILSFGNRIIANDSAMFLFDQTSPLSAPTTGANLVRIDVSFTTNGSFISTNTITINQPQSAVQNVDTVRGPSQLSLAAGGSVPENYNPIQDPNAPSRIAPASLGDLLMTATNTGVPDPTFDFSGQFVADVLNVPFGQDAPDEVGQVLLRVAGVAIPQAADYTWKRIGGTDTGTLVLSNVPSPYTLYNASFTLSFSGTQVGTYNGGVAELIGSFTMVNGN